MNTSKRKTHKGIVIGLSAAAAVLAVCLTAGTFWVQGQDVAVPGPYLTPNQLDDLVAPIALYPDPLISQILVASTYPLEIVEASQWLAKNPNLTGVSLTDAAFQQDWDPSIQALVPFPDVLSYLTQDIAWTTTLGNAFLAQESDVMDAVQRMRASAVQSGKLAPSPQEQIIRTYNSGQTIYTIVPVEPSVIYVPVYDPLWIWGPSYYYPYPRWYHTPHAPVLYYGRGISVNVYFGSTFQSWQGWNSWGWRPVWTGHNIVVNNTFIRGHNLNARNYSIPTGSTNWSHDGTHRQGVPYPSRELADRFRGRNGAPNSIAATPLRGVTTTLPSRSNSVPAQSRVPSVRSSFQSSPAQSSPIAPQRVSPAATNVPQMTTQAPARAYSQTNSQWSHEVHSQPAQSAQRNLVPAPSAPRNVVPVQSQQSGVTAPSRMVPSAREVSPPRESNAGRESSSSGSQSGHGSDSHGNSRSGHR
jgi:Protein of unknown function (DUF3300)